MSRRYQDQVEVTLGDPVEHQVHLEPGWQRGAHPGVGTGEVPTLFLWRGRVHIVRGVLAQWTQRTSWWRRGGDSTHAEPERGELLTMADLEQQVWRVEASAGRTFGRGVYDLVRGEEWLLERVSD